MNEPLGENELVLVRHAPVETPGRLFGRTDVPARLPPPDEIATLRALLASARTRVTSPALRCMQTANAIWGEDGQIVEVEALWEQDFGDWEGVKLKDLPDLGPLSGEELAAHAPPAGESFNSVCARAVPALLDLTARNPGPTVVVTHAGIVRACIADAIGSPARALRFEVACLSNSRFVPGDGRISIVKAINCQV